MGSLAYCLNSTISSSLRGLSASNIVITPSVAVVPVGGWPSLAITRTLPKKWVPHSSRSVDGWPTLLILRRFPFRDNGCPVLAFFCKGGNDAAGTIGCYAQRSASHVWGASPALYHLLLRTMEMEQLSFLFARRGRAGASEWGMDEDFVWGRVA